MRIMFKSSVYANMEISIKTSIPKIISDSLDIKPKDKIAWTFTSTGSSFKVYFDKKDNVKIANNDVVYYTSALNNNTILNVTVPAFIRDLLKLKAGDHILWTIEPFKDDLRINISKFEE